MTAKQFKQWRERMALTQVELGVELSRTKRQIIAYESGERPIPRVVELACKWLEHIKGA